MFIVVPVGSGLLWALKVNLRPQYLRYAIVAFLDKFLSEQNFFSRCFFGRRRIRSDSVFVRRLTYEWHHAGVRPATMR